MPVSTYINRLRRRSGNGNWYWYLKRNAYRTAVDVHRGRMVVAIVILVRNPQLTFVKPLEHVVPTLCEFWCFEAHGTKRCYRCNDGAINSWWRCCRCPCKNEAIRLPLLAPGDPYSICHVTLVLVPFEWTKSWFTPVATVQKQPQRCDNGTSHLKALGLKNKCRPRLPVCLIWIRHRDRLTPKRMWWKKAYQWPCPYP